MRVLFVIPSFAGGGAERQLILLCEALNGLGVQTHVAHLHGGPNLRPALACGARLHQLSNVGNHDPRALIDLLRLIREIRPSVLQTWLLHADVFGGVAAKLSRVPWVLSERSSEAMYANGWKWALRRTIGRYASAVVANSNSGLAYWRKRGFHGPGYVIRNIAPPIQIARVDENVCTSVPPAQYPQVIAIGRLSPEKNFGTLLRALEPIFAKQLHLTAAILGEGPEREVLWRCIESSPALNGRVHLPGHVADVAHWLRRANVCVSLSSFEGLPNTVLEAMAAGCPVVVSDIPAHREVVNADIGVLVPADVGAISKAVEATLKDPASAAVRAGAACRSISGLSSASIAEAYLRVYEELTLKVCA